MERVHLPTNKAAGLHQKAKHQTRRPSVRDIHCSVSAELVCFAGSDFKVISIVSSSFFWPYPSFRASELQLSGTLASKPRGNYRVTNASPLHREDNLQGFGPTAPRTPPKSSPRKEMPLEVNGLRNTHDMESLSPCIHCAQAPAHKLCG
jgi:hypothetical protein